MGQYYIPTLINEKHDISTLYAHDFDNGLKLMEHSWIGNSFVNAALTLIKNRPLRIAWIGDYSNEPYKDLYSQALPRKDFERIYNAAMRRGDPYKLPPSLFSARQLESVSTMKTIRQNLINHTKRQYLNLGEYIASCKYTEKGCYENGQYHPFVTYDMCVHPLPLLTACGNGRGGGDYYEGHPGYEAVGLWAFDLIEYSTKTPKGYDKVLYRFSENETTPIADSAEQIDEAAAF